MAIQRDSRAVDFQAQESLAGPQAQVQGVGNRNPGSVAFDFNQKYQPSTHTESRGWQTDLIAQLVGGIAPHVPDIVKNMQRNEYLEGQTAAVAKKTEDELNSNPLTNSWQIAGHRDMQNRLRIADAKAQFEKDAPALAAQSPEMMQQYLDQRRAKLLPHLSSGSGQVADALTAQLALDEQAAQYRHSGMHKAWIANNIVGAAGSTLQNDFTALKRAQQEAMVVGTPESTVAYQKAVQATAGNMIQGIWMNPRLAGNPEVKTKFTKEALEFALANDELGLFDYIANTPIPLPDGTEAPLVSHMPLDDWSKLADKRRVVDERVGMFRNMEAVQQRAVLDNQIKQGTYEGTYGELTQFLRGQMARKEISQGKYESVLGDYLGMKNKSENEYALAGAAARGDYETMYKLGSSPSDALGKLVDTFAAKGGRPGTPLEAQIPILVQAGQRGTAGAYKLVGERLLPSLTQMVRPDGQIDDQHKQVFQGVMQSVDGLERKARDAAVSDLLSGLPDDKRDMVLGIRMRMQEGKDFGQALSEQQESDKVNAALSPAQKAGMAAARPKEINEAMQVYEPMGLLGQAWNSTKAFFGSSEAATRKAISPTTSPWSDDQTVAKFNQQGKEQIMMEANRQAILNPGLDANALILKAASKVAERTVSTDQGPIFLPHGVKDLNAHFGLPTSAPKSELSAALNTVLKPSQDGNRIQMSSGEGRVAFQEVTPDGAPTSKRGFLDASTVRAAFEENRGKLLRKADEVYGYGKAFQTGGLPVQFNGTNTASVPLPWAYDLRKNLVNNEGFRAQAYDDATGKPLAPGESPKGTTTIGVGLTKDYAPKPGPDGKVSKEQLDQAFWRASNDAAASGRRVAHAIGKPQDRSAFLLMSELAYHSGNSFSDLKTYRPMLDALRAGNKDMAAEAFKSTPAYDKSGASRKKHYLQLIQDIG